MITRTGIIQKHHKNVYFHPLGYVTDVSITQNKFERLLHIGTICAESPGSKLLELVKVDHPHSVMQMIEKLINQNR